MKEKILTYVLDVSSIDETNFDNLVMSVKEYRKDKISKLALFDSKRLSLGVELLIKKACEDFEIDYSLLEIVFNDNGKPYFKDSKYFFNSAHSGKYVILAISDKEVGIDIEHVKEYKQKVAERCFTKKENNYLDITNDKVDLFYRFWTLKESYAKCLGTGLSIPLNSFELTNDDNNIVIKDSNNYQFYEQKYEDYRIAWCVNISASCKNEYFSKMKVIKF